MKNMLASAFLLLTLGASADTWVIDPTHSSVKFTTKYMLISEVEGSFRKFDGTFTATQADFKDLSANMTVEVGSINTDNESRDGHLKGEDFFSADKFPTMTFKSTGIKSLGKGRLVLTGDLTIRDVTKSVEVPLVYGGTTKDPWEIPAPASKPRVPSTEKNSNSPGTRKMTWAKLLSLTMSLSPSTHR